MKVLHIAAIELQPNSGMGRISFEWKLAFERAGHLFRHIGRSEAGDKHALLFGYYAKRYMRSQKIMPDIVLAHEPVAGFFDIKGVPLVVYSHGVEERGWKIQKKLGFSKLSLKSRLLPEQIRFYSNNTGFEKCKISLLSNSEDIGFLVEEKKIEPGKLKLFHNGYYSFPTITRAMTDRVTILFNATWIPRKGVQLIYEVFNVLLLHYRQVDLILAGTKKEDIDVRAGFANEVQRQVSVIESFGVEEEQTLYSRAQIFIMPSFFEGQSVALVQAMFMGLCPVASANCGQKDFIRHHVNGLLFETGSASGFKDQLIWLLQHQEQIKLLGNNARDSVRHFSWYNSANEIVQFCESVL